jgi:Fe-S-cluster-containing dehydrogenase component
MTFRSGEDSMTRPTTPGFSELNTRKRQALVANSASCTGCRTCETVCSLLKTGGIVPAMARIRIQREPFEGSFVPHICHQCSVPACLRACPEGAIDISAKNGVVTIDEGKCTGCGACQEACPFHAIVFDGQKEKCFKCNLCGGAPQCVRFCPAHALGLAFFGGRSEK